MATHEEFADALRGAVAELAACITGYRCRTGGPIWRCG